MKKLLLLALIFTLTNTSFAFTLNPNTGRGFDDSNLKIRIAGTDCSGAGFSTSKFRKMTQAAVKEYWNSVASSSLDISVGSVDSSLDIDGMDHSTALNTVVGNNQIVAGCNDDASDFSNPSILGSALMSCSGDTCKAVLILNANNSVLNSMSTREIEAVIAHEIGHAIGLGHSQYRHNLMYYSVGGKNQKWLGLDDIDGINYLYPHDPELMGLFGNCGTVEQVGSKDPNGFLRSFIFGFLLLLLLRVVYRKLIAIKLN